MCVTLPNFIKIGQTVAEIWRFNGFHNVGHLAFLKFNFFTFWALKRPILHNHAKFHEDLSTHCCDIAIFVIFQDGCRRHLGF